MTTGYREELGMELDLVDELVVAGAAHVPADTAAGAGGPRHAAHADDLLLEADGRSLPDSVALRTVFWRTVRTAGPLLIADLLALAVAGLTGGAVVRLLAPHAAGPVAWAAPLALPLLVLAYWLSGLYSEIWVHPVVELRHLTHVTTLAVVAAAAGGAVGWPAAWPLPLWCAAAWPAAVALVPLCRAVARRICGGRRWWGYPTLVIGSGEGADDIARALLATPRSGLRPVLLTDPRGDCRSSVLTVLNDPDALESRARSAVIRHAVVSLPDYSSARLRDLLDRYSGLVPHLLVLSDRSTLPTLWSASRHCGRLSGIEVRNGLLLATLQGVKRAIDVCVATAAILLGLPALLAVAALVKLTSPGPLFYGHVRIGRRGRAFRAWKFRTMRADAEAVLEAYLSRDPVARREWERDHKLRDDPRVTWCGRFLRRTSLDELPQLWNVLRGDMSLVGPRPIVRDEIRRYADTFLLYASVKPGITGLWQVSGRNDIGYEDRVQLDRFYIRHWSPWLDVYILAKTVGVLLRRNGAY